MQSLMSRPVRAALAAASIFIMPALVSCDELSNRVERVSAGMRMSGTDLSTSVNAYSLDYVARTADGDPTICADRQILRSVAEVYGIGHQINWSGINGKPMWFAGSTRDAFDRDAEILTCGTTLSYRSPDYDANIRVAFRVQPLADRSDVLITAPNQDLMRGTQLMVHGALSSRPTSSPTRQATIERPPVPARTNNDIHSSTEPNQMTSSQIVALVNTINAHWTITCPAGTDGFDTMTFEIEILQNGQLAAAPELIDEPPSMSALQKAQVREVLQALHAAQPFEIPPGVSGVKIRPTFNNERTCRGRVPS